MDELIIETGHSPHITIESHGKLYIKGWDRPEVRSSTSGKDNISITQDGEKVSVQSLSHCEMRVPYEASLSIQAAQSEAIIKAVTGKIYIQKAGAGLTLHDVGPTVIESIDRDLSVREVHGDLTIRQAGRFVNASLIMGNFTADSISSHLTLKQVEGNISAQVSGNSTLNLDPKPNTTSKIETHGVLTCRIPPSANVAVEITGHGPITTIISGKTTTLLNHSHSFTFGEGAATLELIAFGPLTLLEGDNNLSAADHFNFEIDKDLEMDTLSQQITKNVTEQIALQMGMFEAQIDALVETSGMSREKADRIRSRTQEKLARAQEKMARAQERASQKIEIARRKVEQGAEKTGQRHGLEFEYGMEDARRGIREGLAAAKEAVSFALGSTRKPTAPTDPVTEEERMMILNMLAEKKISIEQAESLLAALEGRSD